MVNRAELESGTYLRHFENLPPERVWTSQQRDESIQSTLAACQTNEIWLFAYGSLIWNTTITFAERVAAVANGWQRSFCMHLISGRANPDQPGRMLSLEAGGSVQGVAYRLDDRHLHEDLSAIWLREMVLGAYILAGSTWTWPTGDLDRRLHSQSTPLNTRATCLANQAPQDAKRHDDA